ncbi:uncharacterized protein LOC143880352 isoform X2 [Tasmannia lanceolata]|uniref:uncharacterized protein LOC143880352 isoform X2 n=1 Tax=Tasmannia lanceolata TaxID=3420 RepID=UPI0040635739
MYWLFLHMYSGKIMTSIVFGINRSVYWWNHDVCQQTYEGFWSSRLTHFLKILHTGSDASRWSLHGQGKGGQDSTRSVDRYIVAAVTYRVTGNYLDCSVHRFLIFTRWRWCFFLLFPLLHSFLGN